MDVAVREAKNRIFAAERKVIGRIIEDANDGPLFPRSQWVAWKSGPTGINPCNYGALSPFVDMCVRHNHADGIEWCAKHIEDFVACYWAAQAYNQRYPGEGCAMVNGKFVNWDSDYLRHCTCAGVIDAVRQLPDSVLFSDLVDAVTTMAIHWCQQYTETPWLRKTRETYRMFNALHDLTALYELTVDTIWLTYAHGILFHGWGFGRGRKYVFEVNGEDHTILSYDSGYPWESRGYMSGEITHYSWYMGETVDAFMRLWPYANEEAQYAMRRAALSFHDWHKDTYAVPHMRGFVKPRLNTCVHGLLPAKFENPWIDPDNVEDRIEAEKFFTMGPRERFLLPRVLEWCEIDGGYLEDTLTDPQGNEWLREHHQEDGPSLTAGDGFHVPTIFDARYLLTGYKHDELTGLMHTYLYTGFCDHSADREEKCKEQYNDDWYGGAAGKSRGLAWRLKCNWRARSRWWYEEHPIR